MNGLKCEYLSYARGPVLTQMRGRPEERGQQRGETADIGDKR